MNDTLMFLSNTFYDVSIAEQIGRLALASLLGMVFGIERELKGKPAGFITFMLVSLGSCLIALLQLNLVRMAIAANQATGSTMNTDASRIIAQVVSGVGFLGAGAIIHNRGNVKGITTAALLWVSAALGLCVGIGGTANYIIAIGTVVWLFPASLLARRLARRFTSSKKVHRVLAVYEENFEDDLIESITKNGGTIKKIFFHNKSQEKSVNYKEVYFYIKLQKGFYFENLIESISELDYVIELEEV
jgi:putative Mg2+ transporter-C (MgtC) family protein